MSLNLSLLNNNDTGSAPRDKAWDSSLAFKREGYLFIRNRCLRLDTDIFETRLLLQPTLCMRGSEAAHLFYNTDHLVREGAAPGRLQKTLFGTGGVQGLDGEAHRMRKQLFAPLLNADSIQILQTICRRYWLQAIASWEGRERVNLKESVAEILCQAVSEWCGDELLPHEVPFTTHCLLQMVQGAASIGPAHWQARRCRRELEHAYCKKIHALRAGKFRDNSLMARVASYRDTDGKLLPEHIAAVELLNIIRPTVAITWYILFVALARYRFPQEAAQAINKTSRERFVQEVRRFYPFFPAVMARVNESFQWQDVNFPRGYRVLLDLYGTLHDERLWPAPDKFDPKRFCEGPADPYDFIPQGGGNYMTHHRCAGEHITVALMALALEMINGAMRYTVPRQNLTVSMKQMPAEPKSGFLITAVEKTGR